jgi:hypothetical protein
LEPGGVWQPQRVLARAAELLSRRGLIIVLSDFYDAEADTQRELRRAATCGHDVAVLQVVSPEEMTFPYSGDLDLEDLETGSRQVVDGGDIRAHYRGAMADFLERCRSQARRAGLDYALFTTDTPPERALRQFLLRRQGR